MIGSIYCIVEICVYLEEEGRKEVCIGNYYYCIITIGKECVFDFPHLQAVIVFPFPHLHTHCPLVLLVI